MSDPIDEAHPVDRRRPIDEPWATRPEGAADRDAVSAIVRAAFGRPDEADLVEVLRGDPGWLPGLSYLATNAAGVPVAYALLTRGHIGTSPVVGLAPVAVLPARQHRGAGGTVIRAVLAAAAERGETAAMVLGHPAYYPRFGFRRASEFGVSRPDGWPDEAFLALPLGPGGAVPSGPARYAEPFHSS
ncbi:N-acetyltransferase [Actinocatenispora thailandica]|uniref:N-acetyltransferase n=1 Tax=Actinocatenispora thailandica TaxID=227318 RepID=A0A7R7HXU1_9ACTN|nr:N-acetyltransferase [Actinocatenispora thailandica]BCJ35498.1 N-acetyltransferase [Actinocatenispora thailandica]